jgi:hypothetical protein
MGAVLHDDYLMRMIKQLAAALARLAGRNQKGEHVQALAEVGGVWDEVLGVPRELAEAMDTPALVQLLQHPDRMHAAAQLLRQEAIARRGIGELEVAARLDERAAELEAAAGPSDEHS